MTDELRVSAAAADDETGLTFEEIVATLALAVVVAAVTWGVVTRYALARPANWTGELAGICFAWAVFIGSAAAFRRGGHIAIDAFTNLLPGALARLTRLVADIIVLATLVAVTFLSIRFTLSTTDIPTTVMRLPQAVIYAAAACGFALMTIRHVANMAQGFKTGRAVS